VFNRAPVFLSIPFQLTDKRFPNDVLRATLGYPLDGVAPLIKTFPFIYKKAPLK